MSSHPQQQEEQQKESSRNLQEASELEDFYVRYDDVMSELLDRMELIELHGFKQLVIQDLSERSVAVQSHQSRLQLVLRELMQKFVIDELIEEGYSADDVEEAIEYSLTEVSDRYYDSAVKASKDAAAAKKRKEETAAEKEKPKKEKKQA